MSPTQHDVWSYIWGNSSFSLKKAYKVLIGTQAVSAQFNWLWGSSYQAKHKFFFWLLIHDRLNTRNLLARKNFQLHLMDVPHFNAIRKKLLFIFFGMPSGHGMLGFHFPAERQTTILTGRFLLHQAKNFIYHTSWKSLYQPHEVFGWSGTTKFLEMKRQPLRGGRLFICQKCIG